MIEAFIQWFSKAPFQNALSIVGGSGLLGTAAWWASKWAGRRRIHVRLLGENRPLHDVVLRFEVTNLGDSVTSLQPHVVVRSVTPKRKPQMFVLAVQEVDRALPPHSPKQLTAKATVDGVYEFCWFRRYSFRVTRGRGAIIRYRNVPHEVLPLLRFWYEYVLFRWFGRLVKVA